MPSAHARLRTATRDDHARLDARFPDGLGDAGTYRSYVRGMHRFVADAAAACAAEGDAGATALAARCRTAEADLAADLVSLRASPLAPERLPAIAGPGGWLGWDYVLAGSMLGARQLLVDARGLGHDAARGARFLAHHAEGAGWREVLGRIAAADADAPLHAAARDAFAHAERCFVRARDLEASFAR